MEHYIVRLLDECRSEIQLSDSKASILFAAVATAAAILANVLIDDSSALRTSGAFVVTVFDVCACLVPRVDGDARPLPSRRTSADPRPARHDISRNTPCSPPSRSSSAVVTEDARSPADRHAQQLLTLSRIARRKYQVPAACHVRGVRGIGLAGRRRLLQPRSTELTASGRFTTHNAGNQVGYRNGGSGARGRGWVQWASSTRPRTSWSSTRRKWTRRIDKVADVVEDKVPEQHAAKVAQATEKAKGFVDKLDSGAKPKTGWAEAELDRMHTDSGCTCATPT